MNTIRLIATSLFLLASMLLAPAQSRALDQAEHMTVGQTVHMTLGNGDTKDYTISLNKGSYVILLDAQRSDGASSNIQATIRLLKNNGVVVNDNLLTANEIGGNTRVGAQFFNPKPLPARLRISSNQDADYWMTVLPASSAHFVPFGFGKDVSPAKVGTQDGVGGTLDKNDTAYYSATLKPGKWSISLGLATTDGASTNIQGHVDLLNTLGEPVNERFVVLNEIDKESRKEGVLTVIKPTAYLFRVVNDSGSIPYTYDLTILPATD